MKKLLFAISILFISSTQALEWDYCGKIKDNSQRLACFDRVYAEIKPENQKGQAVDDSKNESMQSKWELFQEESDFDSSIKLYLGLEAENTVKTTFGTEETPVLLIQCVEDKTEMVVASLGGVIDSNYRDHSSTFKVKIDQEDVFTKRGGVSVDRKGIFINKPIGFIKSLFGKDKLGFKVPIAFKGDAETSFQISGLEEAIKPLREACRWQLAFCFIKLKQDSSLDLPSLREPSDQYR